MSNKPRRPALFKAAAASFGVYLLPLIGPHGALPIGVAVWAEFFELRGDREALWLAVDAALVAAIQLAALGLFYWMLRGRRAWRWLALLPAVPGFIMALNLSYQIAVPRYFLVAPDAAPEQGHWGVACSVPGVWLHPVSAGPGLAFERAREVLISRWDAPRNARLTMPGCAVTPVAGVPEGVGGEIGYAVPGGFVLHRAQDPASGEVRHWYVAPGAEAVELAAPPEADYQPILSADGGTVAWFHKLRGENRAVLEYRVRLETPATGATRTVTLDLAKRTSYRLLAFDARSGVLTVAKNYDEMMAVDLAGKTRWGPDGFAGFGGVENNARRVGDGWVAWDSLRENAPYRLAWSLAGGAGSHQVPKGRGISAVAVDPDGKLIAVSVSTSARVTWGDVDDAVYVMRAVDGAEIYRRYLPPYSRTQLAFLGPHYLAMTRNEAGESRVDVLQVPFVHDPARAAPWIAAYRTSLLPLLPMFAAYDSARGLGEADCGPLAEALPATRALALDQADAVTRDLVAALIERLAEAERQCARWDPSPFSLALSDAEYLMQDVERQLMYELGQRALPELPLFDGSIGGAVTPFEDADGKVRVKRTLVIAP